MTIWRVPLGYGERLRLWAANNQQKKNAIQCHYDRRQSCQYLAKLFGQSIKFNYENEYKFVVFI